MESACTRVNCVFLDQISGTATGWLVVFRGGSFGGEIKSLIFFQNPPKLAFQFTSRSEFTFPRTAGRKNSLRFSRIPAPKCAEVNTVCLPRTFAGRSVKKSFRLEEKPLRRPF